MAGGDAGVPMAGTDAGVPNACNGTENSVRHMASNQSRPGLAESKPDRTIMVRGPTQVSSEPAAIIDNDMVANSSARSVVKTRPR